MIEEHLSRIRSKEAESKERIAAAEAEAAELVEKERENAVKASRRRAAEGGRARALAPRRRAAERRREDIGAPRREREEARRARRPREEELRKGDRDDSEGVSRGRLAFARRAASIREVRERIGWPSAEC